MKKIMALLLAAAMIVSLIAVPAFAAEKDFDKAYISKLKEEFREIEMFYAREGIEKMDIVSAVAERILNRPVKDLGSFEGSEDKPMDNPLNKSSVRYKIAEDIFDWYLVHIFKVNPDHALNNSYEFYYYGGFYYGNHPERTGYDDLNFKINDIYEIADGYIYVDYEYVSNFDQKTYRRYAVLGEGTHEGDIYFSHEKISSDPIPQNELDKYKPNIVTVTVNKNPVVFDQPPVIQDGRTLVPIRAVFEAIGCEVEWEQSTKTVTLTKKNTKVTFAIGSEDYIVYRDGKIYKRDKFEVQAQIIGGRTLVPLRAICEEFGCRVRWEDATKTVVVTF